MTGPNESLLRELAFGEDWNINGLAELTGRAKALKANIDSLISSLDGKWEGEAATAGVAALRDQSERLARFAELTDKALAEVTGMSTTYCAAGGGANGVRTERAETLLANLPPGELPWWLASTVYSGTPVHYQGMEVTADNGALGTLSTRAKQQREAQAGVALDQMRTVIGNLSSKLRRVDVELGAITAPGAGSRSGTRGSSTGGLSSIDGAATGWTGDLAGRGFGGGAGAAGWAGGTSSVIGTGGAGAGAGFGSHSGSGRYPGYGPVSGGGDYLFPSAGSGSGGSTRGDGGAGYSPVPGYGGPYTSGDGSGPGPYPGDSPTYWQSTGVDNDSHGVTSTPGRGLLAGGGAGAAFAAGSAGLRGGSGAGNGVLGALFGRAGGAGGGIPSGGIGAGGFGSGGIASPGAGAGVGAGGFGGPGAGASRPGVGAAGGAGTGLGGGRGGLSGALGAAAPGSGGTGSGGSGSGGASGARPAGMMAGGMGGGNNTASKGRRRGLGMIAPRLEDSPEGGPASDVSRAGRRTDGNEYIPGEHDYLDEHGYYDSVSGEYS